tara:strand:- start:64782 stop:66971 length:2190 start_codon:yes stop_codon:yes gene_type:complete
MKKIILGIMLIISVCHTIKAQNSTITIKILSEIENEPLFGATVYFESLNKGTITDFDGLAIFNDIENNRYKIIISYLGYQTLETIIDTNNSSNLIFHLRSEANELDEIVIQSTRSTRTIQKVPTRIEFIGVEELGEKAIMNPTNISMVLRESTGIQMQQTSLSSGNSNIRIQGLDGRYTQLLRDGFPLYSGFSSGLSIMQIPPLDLKQFEIIKGSSSTLYGGGSIAGIVNMVSKTPSYLPELDIMLTQTQALGSTANIFFNKRNNKFGISLYASGHYQKEYDPENDGFSNLPKTTSISFNPKIFYYPTEKTTIWFGINGIYDNRIGGDIKKFNEVDNDEIHQYTEENISKRFSTQGVYSKAIDSLSTFRIKNSISFFDRNLIVPDVNFKGEQINSFSEATYEIQALKSDWIFGANLYTTNFKEKSNTNLKRNQNDVTYGFFTNAIFDLSENWILESGLRADIVKNNQVFPLPRISLLYKNESGFSSRIGGGLGYKIPDIFTEEAEAINFKNILPIDQNRLSAERSYGMNLDFNYRAQIFENIVFSVNQLFYITAITNGLLLNSTNNGLYEFENATGKILSKGAETNIKFKYKDFNWFLNYALVDAKLNYLPDNPQKPLTAKHNIGSVFMYESDLWRIGYETYYTGKQFLSNGSQTTDFVTMGLLLMRNFNWGGTFINFENFTDRRQSKFSPLILPPHEDPIFPEIYAPTDGFIFSVGIILKPFENNSHH